MAHYKSKTGRQLAHEYRFGSAEDPNGTSTPQRTDPLGLDAWSTRTLLVPGIAIAIFLAYRQSKTGKKGF